MEPVETQAAPVVRAQGVVKRYGAKVALDGSTSRSGTA